jgi:diguanylate cyclase (GGDEF)-like protein
VRRRNGSDYPAWVMVSPVRPSRHDISHYIVTSIDITDRKKSEQRIRFLAQHDVLTELPNRSLCVERLRQAIQQAPRHQQRVAVMFIDLDRFKDINDSLGHHIGDALLRSVSRRLTDAVRAGDTVSRLGGDEFVVVLSSVQDADEAAHIVNQRLIPLIRQPHPVDGAELHISCSVGIAMWPEDGGDVDTLMRNADAAMYQAKAAGKDGARFFNAEMTERAQARLALEAQLRRAVEAGDQFELRWQPRVDAATGRLVGAEGLIRWHHPERGLVSPGEFIPVAEETGMIVPIGNWVIGEACRQIAAWRAEGFSGHGFSINLSARQLRDRGLADEVRAAVSRHGIAPGELELELTESMVMEQAELALSQMHALRALGVGLSIDDFGTGYSSLAYLNRFPIDKLKIDRSFVHDMLGDTTDLAIIKAIIRLGHSLGLRIVAEGVERPDEAAMLREAGCDELQGYLFSVPLRAPDLLAWVRRATPRVPAEAPVA